MSEALILLLFLGLRFGQQAAEFGLAWVNRRYYLDPRHQREAQTVLGLTGEDLAATIAYAGDKYRFALLYGWTSFLATMTFLAFGGLGAAEALAARLAGLAGGGGVLTGLSFFGLLALAGMALSLPFDYYRTFTVEERHGFNRQTRRGFWLDRLKGLALAVLLGAPFAAALLWIMGAAGPLWWAWAWAAMTGFSVLTAWLYPTFLAPLFNKFTPVALGELNDRVAALADRVGFRTAGVYVMDASKRSSHGNAYFTGVFGKKRIVLFDTLVEAMSVAEVVAVLAHELGHFKLHHVRWSLLRGTLMTGLTFYLLSLCLPLAAFYRAFGLAGVSSYGALVVFFLWFGPVDFLLSPLATYLSRRNEFAADQFAKRNVGGAAELGSALLKLREKSHALPISHPAFSTVYHSHPPLMERLKALGVAAKA